MSRPKSKKELLDSSTTNYKKLLELIDSFSGDEVLFEFPDEYLNRNIRDVLAHLHHWHLMLIGWYKVGLEGKKPEVPAAGYSWKDLPELNRGIQKQYQNHTLRNAKTLLKESHEQVQDIIQKHSNQELFEKKKYPWTGSTSMGAYFISAASSHYDWATKLIKKCDKNKKA